MWVWILLGAWLLLGVLVALFFAVVARGGSGTRRPRAPRPPSRPNLSLL